MARPSRAIELTVPSNDGPEPVSKEPLSIYQQAHNLEKKIATYQSKADQASAKWLRKIQAAKDAAPSEVMDLIKAKKKIT